MFSSLLSLLLAAGTGCTIPSPWQRIIYHIPVKKPMVALTFDDGPDRAYTPEILAALKNNHAHATFFILGRKGEWHKDLVGEIVRFGNEVAVHGYVHVRMSRFCKATLEDQISQSVRSVQRASRMAPQFFRPPYGRWSTNLLDTSWNHGLTVVLWNRDSKDWAIPGTDGIVTNAMDRLAPGNILLFHDGGGDRSQTVAALPKLLNRLRKSGYQAVSVGELIREGLKTGLDVPVAPSARESIMGRSPDP